MQLLVRLLLGLAFSALIALFAYRRKSLSRSGAVAAIVIGSTIYVGGGGLWFLALVTFFASSSVLGKVGAARKASIKREFEKGDTRDGYQAFSNGGVAAACALAMAFAPSPCLAAAFVGSLATAAGDTWATELGVLSRAEPWSLVKLCRVPRGTSGAVSPLGLCATALGGLAIGTIAALGSASFLLSAPMLLLAGILGGVLGSLVDSALGATLQAGYHCPRCACDAEGARHHCGTSTKHVRGLAWLDNDLVNLAATACGALLGALVPVFLPR